MITLLKLGGSLITEKDQAHTLRPETILSIGSEIKRALSDDPNLKLIIGHGSGSFGHIPAKRYQTREGVFTAAGWQGFAEVSAEAADLNRSVTALLRSCGLPVISFSPLSAVQVSNRTIVHWDKKPIFDCLQNGLIPLVYGDTVFDDQLGGTILSTEDLFTDLARDAGDASKAGAAVRILLAGREEGIWQDYPKNQTLIRELNIRNINKKNVEFIQASEFPDVTGGMFSKVQLMAALLQSGLISEAHIFSGNIPENIYQSLTGTCPGTKLWL
jgi:isopentenyl phosphate kinase